MNKNANEAAGANSSASPVSLETMLGEHNFEAQGRVYTLFPVKLKHIPEFQNKKNIVYVPMPNEPVGNRQFAYLQNEQYVKTLDKWLQRQLRFNDEPVTYEMIVEHDWDVDDLGRFLREMARLSG
jgi:hypothetical protein